MNKQTANMIRAWKPPPPCDRVGCGALHPPGVYHGPATLEKDFGNLTVIALVCEDDDGWTAEAQIIQTWTGPWSGDAVLRFPDGSTSQVFIEETRFAAGSYAEFRCRGLGGPPDVLDARAGSEGTS
ncbi:hypothetical protein ACIBQX_18850 [Nonomuraea sp. NPDC049714]|uniref:hypothetical protein n=1 Tax=Nonomuraea sp. NPDC049714 TaxID=3364357 RepID=UPI0037A6F94B